MAHSINGIIALLRDIKLDNLRKDWKFTVASVLLGGAAAVFLWRQRKSRNFPSGPRGWPVVGNFLQLDPKKPHQNLEAWAKEHGDIYSISLLGKRVVVLNSYELIYEAMVQRSEEFAGRPYFYRTMMLYQHGDTVGFSTFSPRWALLKKCLATAMKMYGEGLTKLEHITLDILSDLKDKFISYNGESIDPLTDIYDTLANIVASIVFARQLSPDALRTLLRFMEDSTTTNAPDGPGCELEVFPWLRYLPHKVYRELDRIRNDMDRWLTEQISENKTRYTPNQPTCVLDFLLDQQQTTFDDDGIAIFSDLNIKLAVLDLHGAGTLTTTTVLYTLFALWAVRPDLQHRLQQEIDQQLEGRLPRLADRSAMPFTEATILETLRYISHFPISLPHLTTKNTTLKGYQLPKGTEIWFNLWRLHHDEHYWDNPWEFLPERFLAEDGTLIPPDHPIRKNLLSFGAGRRVCLGEAFARNRLFLFVTYMLQQFNVLLADDAPVPRPDPRDYRLGIVLRGDRYKIKLQPRDA